MSVGYQIPCIKCGKTFVARPGANSSAPWFLRWYVLAGAGGGALLILLSIGGGMALLMLNRGSQPDEIADVPAPTQSEPVSETVATPEKKTYAVKLSGPTELAIDAGKMQTFDVKVERDGFPGEVLLNVDELPAGVSIHPSAIPAGEDTASLEMMVAKETVAGTPTLKIVATANESQVEHTLALTVRAMQPMTLVAPTTVRMNPNGSTTIDVSVTRNGHAGPIQIEASGLPTQIQFAPLTIPAEAETGTLTLKGVKVPEKAYPTTLTAKIGDQVAESKTSLIVESYAFKVADIKFPVEWVGPGSAADVPITVARRSYQGPLTVTVEGMPEGITSEPLEIAENATKGTLKLVCAADAKAKVRSGKIVVSAPAGRSETLLITRVKGDEGALLGDLDVEEELADNFKKGSFGGRIDQRAKQKLMDVFGGTDESEKAVMAGLAWLADNQNQDGSWTLGVGGDAGEPDKNPTAATAFGILPMLGAGVTHKSAPSYPAGLSRYKGNVRDGLIFLARNQKRTKDANNGDLQGGMYAHALGTIALCEAYALTKDEDLKVPAQLAVRYLMTAQHSASGSWGYSRNRAGDTSVVAWVVLAIRSGQLAGLPTKRSVLDRTERFLNKTAAGPDGSRFSRYAYKPVNLKDAADGHKKAKISTTAAGLLSRQYLGWQLDRQEFPAGADYLMGHMPPKSGKAAGSNYYFYYATQVLHHLEGKNWDLWNHYMREHFIRCQELEGSHKGSWSPIGSDYGSRGGRMYTTSMCLLTLEVYYRHLPLYRKISKPEA